MSKKYWLINKKKFISFLVFLLIIVIISIGSLLNKHNRVYSSVYQKDYTNVKVLKGDTLWDIAIDYMPKGYDVRKMVFEIIEFNDMEGAYIYPGDSIKVPIIKNKE